MATFQIVYDDFSGGHYVGQRSTELPRNTYFGENVMTLPNGRVASTGSKLAYTWGGVTSATACKIADHWVIGNNAYVFATWTTSGPTYTSKMLKVQVNNGTTFTSPTASESNMTGQLGGRISYDNISGKFFYVRTDGGSAGYIRSITTAGTDASVSTALGGQGITDLVLYGYRNVAWGGTSRKLFYSNTDLTTFSTSQYYEFAGAILNVLPRSGDLLVVCTTGVYSMTGVLGSGVTIQQIVPEATVTEGMRDGVVYNRAFYYLDQSLSGAPDGRVYEMLGTSTRPVAVMDMDDVKAAQGLGYQQGRISVLNDGRLCVMLRSGICYVQSEPGTWARLDIDTPSMATATTQTGLQQVGRCGPEALNEYFIVATVDLDTSKYPVEIHRAIHNDITPPFLDRDYVFTQAQSTATNDSVGSATFPEYWHNKPFTVKEIVVEFAGTVAVQVAPTGMPDLDASVTAPASTSVSFTAGSAQVASPTYTRRYRTDNAGKGYGMKPTATLTNGCLKRLIVVCED